MMKLKTIVAASTLAAAGTVGVMSSSASAVCGVALEAHNVGASNVTVDWADSDVRLQLAGGINGPWNPIGVSSTVIAPGATYTMAFLTPCACALNRQYRLEVNQNGVASYVLFPGVGLWTLDTTPHIHVA
jgi:hypothetical protein